MNKQRLDFSQVQWRITKRNVSRKTVNAVLFVGDVTDVQPNDECGEGYYTVSLGSDDVLLEFYSADTQLSESLYKEIQRRLGTRFKRIVVELNLNLDNPM